MKAVILAGGEGLRLRPISAGLPKPMVPFLDRPVLEHVIGLLKRHGITDLALTLQAMPQTVASWLGDGAELGVKLTYFVEREPLGTAGSVKRCMSWLGEEDFLVISGDIITDIDLTEAAGFHRASRAAATLVLCRHSSPLEYGQVLTGDDGKVRSFVEKPAWSQVLTDTVNTGIYFLTAKAMEGVPEGTAYDFSRDLFPRLLEQGAPSTDTSPRAPGGTSGTAVPIWTAPPRCCQGGRGSTWGCPSGLRASGRRRSPRRT